MRHASRARGKGWDRSRLRWSAAALAVAVTAACVSLPQPAGPVTLEGRVPPFGDDGGSVAAPAPGAVRGPLLLRNARLTVTENAWLWQAELVNPSGARFESTVVVTLLDEAGTPLSHQTRDLELGPHQERRLEGRLEGAAAAQRFRVEYWVRVPPPPDRRIDRIGG